MHACLSAALFIYLFIIRSDVKKTHMTLTFPKYNNRNFVMG